MTPACDYVRAGMALVPIPSGRKGPTTRGWQTRERCITDDAGASRVNGGNLGIAHAYCMPSPTCAIDIDDYDAADAWLRSHDIDMTALLAADDAVQIRSGRPGRAKLIYRLPHVMPTVQPPGSGLELRCASRNGMTVQDVMPPSIHPDTGRPYEWVGDWRAIPDIPPALLALWEALVTAPQQRRGEHPDTDGPIPEGGRNATLASMAGSMRRRGMTEPSIEAALLAENAARCDPPLSDAEVRMIARSVGRYPAGAEPAQPAGDWTLDVPPAEGARDAPRRKPYTILLARDFRVARDAAYTIKGLWHPGTLAVTWGPSGGGKSYVTADMALHVVSGREWCGHRVRRSGVVYLCAEAPASMERRFVAMCDHSGLDRSGLPLAILAGSLHMLHAPDGVIAAITDAAVQLRAVGGVSDVMLIIDTLARSAPGMDENGPEDMGAFVGVCDRIRLELGMACVVVHHAGKDVTRGARGHGALKAAADCELLIAERQISAEKLRDGATGSAIPFSLHPIELGTDSDGDAITACHVEYGDCEQARQAKANTRIPPTSTIAFEALREALHAHGELLPATSALPGGKSACDAEQWRRQFYGRIADRDSDAQRQAFRRAKDDLMARQIIGAWESRVWIW